MSEEAKLSRQVGAKAKIISKFSPLEADKGKKNEAIIANYGVTTDDGKIDYAATLEKLLAHIKENDIKEKRDSKNVDNKVYDAYKLGIATSSNGEYYILSEKAFSWLDEIVAMFNDGNGENNLTEITSKVNGFKEEVNKAKQMAKLDEDITKYERKIDALRTQMNKLRPQSNNRAD